jgi:hypothetical protein
MVPVSISVFSLATSLLAATYEASVGASIRFAEEGAIAVGDDETLIFDFFDPILLSGNAGFDPFAGVASFNFANQLLSLSLSGPSGFANPFGRSVAGGSINTPAVFLTNVTPDELSLTVRVDYFYSLSASAANNETASSTVELELFSRDGPAEIPDSIFRFGRAVSQNGSESAGNFVDVFLTLAPGGQFELFFTAETGGEANVVPEPTTFLTGCIVSGLVLVQVTRCRSDPRA